MNPTNSLWVLLLVVVAPLMLWANRRRTSVQSARNIRELGKKLYEGRHEHAEVSLEQIPGLDLPFYETSRAALEAAGYRFLADIEDLTATAASPQMRTAVRVLVSGDRRTSAAVYHVKVRGALGLLLRLFGHSNVRSVELESVTGDELFVSTSTASLAGSIDQPPEIDIEFLPAETSIADLLERHTDRLAAWERAHPDSSWTRFESLGDVLRWQDRLQDLKNRFRRERGAEITPEEVRRVDSSRTAEELASRLGELDEEDR